MNWSTPDNWHWGHANLLPGTPLVWRNGKTKVIVASGDGRLEAACGTLVQWGEGLASLAFVTRDLLGSEPAAEGGESVLDLWSVDGTTLAALTLQGHLKRRFQSILDDIYGDDEKTK